MNNGDWLTRPTLIDRARDQSDEGAWEEFASYYRGFMLVILKKLGIAEKDHEDIMQDSLVRVWKGLHTFDLDHDRAKFRTWLKTLIRNTAFSYYKKHKKHDLKTTSIHTEDGDIDIETEGDLDQWIEREWDAYICHVAMKKVKSQFSERAIRVFEMFLDGVEVGKIGEEMGLKENSVYKLKNRVRSRLKDEIERLCRELEPNEVAL